MTSPWAEGDKEDVKWNVEQTQIAMEIVELLKAKGLCTADMVSLLVRLTGSLVLSTIRPNKLELVREEVIKALRRYLTP